MNCKDFQLYASAHIDHMLTDEEEKLFIGHLQQCEKCKASYENFKLIIESVQSIEEVELPEGFSENLRKNLELEKKKNKFSRMVRAISGIAVCMLIIGISVVFMNNTKTSDNLISSLEKNNKMDINEDISTHETTENNETEEKEMSMLKSLGDAPIEPRMASESLEESLPKITKQVYLDLQVDDLQESYEKALKIIEERGGYVDQGANQPQMMVTNRALAAEQKKNVILQVPSEVFSDTVEELKELGSVIEKNINEENFSEKYGKIEEDIANLRRKEKQLLATLEDKNTEKDVEKIEEELNKINGQITHLSSVLQSYNKSLSFFTIQLQIKQ